MMAIPIDGIIWRADAQRLRFDLIEGNVSEILGFSAEDWLATDGFWQSRLHPEDADSIITRFAQLAHQRGPHRLIYRLIAADGRIVWVQDNISVIHDAGQLMLSGVIVDVTVLVEQRHQIETTSRRNAHYRALYNLVPVAIWEEEWSNLLAELRALHAQGVTDIRKHAQENDGFVNFMLNKLSVLAVNPAAVDMFRARNAADLISRAHEVFDADQPYSVFLTALDAILRGTRRIEGVTTLRRLTGERVHVEYRIALPNLDDKKARVVICEMDISAERAANERFELVTRATADVIWDFDLLLNTIWVSDSSQRIFGINAAEFAAGLPAWTARMHPDDVDNTLRNLDRNLQSGNDMWEEKYRLRTGDDSYAWVRADGFILRDASGAAIRMVGSLVDITEQQRLEEQLLQARKLEAIGKLTGGMAHDFNNLLTVVMGSLDSLEDRVGDDSVSQHYVAVANRAVDRSAQLINRLLSYARKQPMVVQTVDVARQVQEIRHMLQRTLGDDVAFVVTDNPDLWQCLTDPGQFESALLNLCINARDAMPQGGKLTIEMRNIDVGSDSSLIRLGLVAGRYVQVSVTDTGEGMDKSTAQAAFDPFFTTKEFGTGSGLGLSMVQGFAHQSRGIVTIQSEPGNGTVVALYLPAIFAVHPVGYADAPAGQVSTAGAGHVLLVEDQDIVRVHMAGLLERLGYRVTSAVTVAQASAVLSADQSVNLVFTDIILPGGESGLELGRYVQNIRTGLPVVYMSGFSDTVVGADKVLREGENFLRKPFRRKELAKVLQQALEKA
ncbi:MAG: PAS domain-containing protein [Loktanella sp.]|nr:PAS domain-containing protein [Loktanella sp.]